MATHPCWWCACKRRIESVLCCQKNQGADVRVAETPRLKNLECTTYALACLLYCSQSCASLCAGSEAYGYCLVHVCRVNRKHCNCQAVRHLTTWGKFCGFRFGRERFQRSLNARITTSLLTNHCVGFALKLTMVFPQYWGRCGIMGFSSTALLSTFLTTCIVN